MRQAWGGKLRAQKTQVSGKSYLKHSEERRGPIQLALIYRSLAVNGKDGLMDLGKEGLSGRGNGSGVERIANMAPQKSDRDTFINTLMK